MHAVSCSYARLHSHDSLQTNLLVDYIDAISFLVTDLQFKLQPHEDFLKTLKVFTEINLYIFKTDSVVSFTAQEILKKTEQFRSSHFLFQLLHIMAFYCNKSSTVS